MTKRLLIATLLLGLFAPGCILTSGQIIIDFEFDGTYTSTSGIEDEDINLNTEDEYLENKEKLRDLADIAVLGKFKNNASTAVSVEVWMTPVETSYTSEAAVKADPMAKKIWGPFVVKGDQTVQIGWDESAKLFNSEGKALILNETKGDGKFTLYAFGAAGTYDFTISNGALVLTLDAGI